MTSPLMIGTGEETDLSVSAIFKSRKDPWILDFPDYSSWKTKEDTYTDTYIPKLGGCIIRDIVSMDVRFSRWPVERKARKFVCIAVGITETSDISSNTLSWRPAR